MCGQGNRFSTLRLYEDAAIARQVQQDLCFVDQRIYGVMTGPLEEMEDADVVMLLCNGWQMMRLIQGYTWHHGMAKEYWHDWKSGNLCRSGSQTVHEK